MYRKRFLLHFKTNYFPVLFCILFLLNAVIMKDFVYGQERTRGETRRLTLEESIETALERSKNLLIAKSKISEANSGVSLSMSAFLPKVSTAFNYTRLDEAPFFPTSRFAQLGMGGGESIPAEDMPKKITIGDYNNYAAAFTIRQPVFTGGKIKNSYKISEFMLDAAEANVEKTQNDLIFDVEKAYWNLIKVKEFKKVAEDAVELVEAHMRDLNNMFEVGMVTENDLLRTKVQLSNARLQLIQATNGVQLATISFCNTLGIPLDTDIELIDKLETESIPELDLDKIISKAFMQRPELKSLDSNIEIAKKSIEINNAGYLPDIYFSTDYGYRRPDREYNKDFYGTWTVSFLAQFNLFDWGETSYKISESKERLYQTEIAREQLKDGITLEVTSNYLKLFEAGEIIEMSRINVQQAEENYRATDDRFKEGFTTNTELLDANTLLARARTDYIAALADYRTALAGLKKSTGELYINR